MGIIEIMLRHETSRYFKKKKREYLKDKVNELATYRKNKNIGDLQRGRKLISRWLPSHNFLNENGDLYADSHNILKRWKTCFSCLLNVHTYS
jgi:hypothetical protein